MLRLDSVMSFALSPALIVAITVFFTVLGLAVAIGGVGSRGSSRLRERLNRHAVNVPTTTVARTARFNVLGQAAGDTSPLLARTLGRLLVIQSAGPALVRANLTIGVVRFFLLRLVLAAAVFAVAQIVVGGFLLPAVAAIGGFWLPGVVVTKLGSRRGAAFEGQLAEALDVIVGSLRAGQGLVQAIESSSQEQPEPMRTELRLIVDQVNLGVSMTEAMESLTTRFDSRDVDLLAAAIAINRQTGGNLTEVLERLAGTVRQRRAIRAEAKSLTAAPRATGYILAVLPVAIAAYSTAVSPVYREQLLETGIGRIILVGACSWSLLGFFISQKLAKVEY